jgi:hypothetical protein
MSSKPLQKRKEKTSKTRSHTIELRFNQYLSHVHRVSTVTTRLTPGEPLIESLRTGPVKRSLFHVNHDIVAFARRVERRRCDGERQQTQRTVRQRAFARGTRGQSGFRSTEGHLRRAGGGFTVAASAQPESTQTTGGQTTGTRAQRATRCSR